MFLVPVAGIAVWAIGAFGAAWQSASAFPATPMGLYPKTRSAPRSTIIQPAACAVGLQPLWPSPLKQRMRHLGHKAAGPFDPGLYYLKNVRRPRSKDGSHSQAGDPRGPSTCHHLCNLQPTHLIEAPRNRACSTQIAMPTRVYRPRRRWRASLSFAKPGSSS